MIIGGIGISVEMRMTIVPRCNVTTQGGQHDTTRRAGTILSCT